jgi:hypothetical protein
MLTVLLAKHITSCNNVFLKEYFFLSTYGMFRPILSEVTVSKIVSKLKRCNRGV